MVPRFTNSIDRERERRELIRQFETDYGENWREDYAPGTYGCHELLDRSAFAIDSLERYVLTHPACVANQEWFTLVEQAIAILYSMNNQVGAAHLQE